MSRNEVVVDFVVVVKIKKRKNGSSLNGSYLFHGENKFRCYDDIGDIFYDLLIRLNLERLKWRMTYNISLYLIDIYKDKPFSGEDWKKVHDLNIYISSSSDISKISNDINYMYENEDWDREYSVGEDYILIGDDNYYHNYLRVVVRVTKF